MTTPDPLVEMQIGGTWTDITNDVYFDGGVTTTRGRSGEGARVDPAMVNMRLKSPDGKYAARHPMSSLYGRIGRNTPVRTSVGGASTALDLPEDRDTARASTPDHVSLDITGDIDVRADLTPLAWAGSFTNGAWEVMGKYVITGNQRSWRLLVQNPGLIEFTWSPDGTNLLGATSTVGVPHAPGRRGAIRATLDVNNGASGRTVTFYTAPTMAGPWSQLGSPVTTAGVTSIFNSTAPLEVGNLAALGFDTQQLHVHAVEVRSGIGGTLAANPDFTAQTIGASSFTDGAGRLWTLANGAAITDRRRRFVVEVPEWSPRWSVGGADMNVPIQGGGILRRLSQGAKALESTLRRRIPSYNPLAYWPLEDGAGATQAYSPIEGVPPLQVSGGWTFGSESSLAGSSALPSVEATARMRAAVPAPSPSSSEWSVHMVYSVDSAPATDGVFLSWTSTGTMRRWRIVEMAGVAHVQAFNSAGDLTLDQAIGIGPDLFTGWQRLAFSTSESGGTVTWRITWWNIGGTAGTFSSTYSGSAGRVVEIDTQFGTSLSGLHVGHLAVFSVADVDAYNFADHGFTGETAGARAIRLTREEGVPFRLLGDATAQEPMGPQRPDTLLNLLRQCEETDGGILYEDRNQLGLVYRGRSTLYNQEPALTLPYSKINQPFEPVDDDTRIRNDVTRSREDGSSARAVLEEGPLSVQAPPLGVGTYDESVAVSAATDAQLEQLAAWALHLGTWDEARYKQVRILLHKHPSLIPALTGVDVGDIVRVTDLPPFLPPGPVDLMVEGYPEALTGLTWEITFACSPGGPWTVGVVEDPVLGRADTDGCTLTAGITATATSVAVTSTPGPPWIDSATFPTMFPFDVTVGGEVMRVTACTGTGLAQTFTVTRSVNGIAKPHTAGAPLSLTYPMRAAL
ncbi:hypothetical protein [[Kitasatospora] papulosa]|uniref:hypothetical protein n=1 Tax=[Kitasatospora] papulosa TaxID=1464011 RepID=UPI003640277E